MMAGECAVVLIRLCSAVMAYHDALSGSQQAASPRAELSALIESLAPTVEVRHGSPGWTPRWLPAAVQITAAISGSNIVWA